MRLDADDLNEIAKAWICLNRLPEEAPEREDAFWAHERICALVEDNPEAAWEVIQLIRREGSDRILANLAAGPLEDLLVAHGDRFIDRVEGLAGHDAQFRRLLGATWRNAMPEELWKRIKAVAGPSW